MWCVERHYVISIDPCWLTIYSKNEARSFLLTLCNCHKINSSCLSLIVPRTSRNTTININIFQYNIICTDCSIENGMNRSYCYSMYGCVRMEFHPTHPQRPLTKWKFDSIKYLYDVMKNEYSRICSFCAVEAFFFVFLYAVHSFWSVVPASDSNQTYRRRVAKPIAMPIDEWIWVADRNVSHKKKFQFTWSVGNLFSISVRSHVMYALTSRNSSI